MFFGNFIHFLLPITFFLPKNLGGKRIVLIFAASYLKSGCFSRKKNERIHRVAEAGWVGHMTYKGVYVASCLSDSESRKFRTKVQDKATVDARVRLYKGNIVYPRVGFCVAHPSFLRAMREP